MEVRPRVRGREGGEGHERPDPEGRRDGEKQQQERPIAPEHLERREQRLPGETDQRRDEPHRTALAPVVPVNPHGDTDGEKHRHQRDGDEKEREKSA
jgi:hypothetical protein